MEPLVVVEPLVELLVEVLVVVGLLVVGTLGVGTLGVGTLGVGLVVGTGLHPEVRRRLLRAQERLQVQSRFAPQSSDVDIAIRIATAATARRSVERRKERNQKREMKNEQNRILLHGRGRKRINTSGYSPRTTRARRECRLYHRSFFGLYMRSIIFLSRAARTCRHVEQHRQHIRRVQN